VIFILVKYIMHIHIDMLTRVLIYLKNDHHWFSEIAVYVTLQQFIYK